MSKGITIFLLVINHICFAQNFNKAFKIDAKALQYSITQKQEHNFSAQFTKDIYYNISVEQQGIDVVVYVKDKNNKIIEEKDSPTGNKGIETITFSPDTSDLFTISIKPLEEKTNSAKGNYTIRISTIPKKLTTYNLEQLNQDFEIIKKTYFETRVGLWYNSYAQFDSICQAQKSQLKDKMTALDFYKIIAPVTTFTKEGHCFVSISDGTNSYLKQYGSYLPFFVRILDQKIYILNDIAGYNTTGLMIAKINGIDADSILTRFMRIEPSDGYNLTSKYHWIEGSFAKYYLRFFGSSNFFSIECINPVTKEKTVYNIPALTYKGYSKSYLAFIKKYPGYKFNTPALFSLDTLKKEAILTINSFGTRNYDGGKTGFQKYLDSVFTRLKEKKIENLVIDIRKNEGGAQGMEDLLLSHLITDNYHKYKYVEIPSFTYSFLKYTDYKGEQDTLRSELSEEFYQTSDGRYLNKKGYYEGAIPHSIHFDGTIYILISGLTFSGGSEFAALAKNYTNAIFIGEETGGGYYGNTSGSYLKFTLPYTQLKGRVPLCKFVIETKNNSIPFGRGVLPDYEVRPTIQDFLAGKDVELEFVRKLIKEKNSTSANN